MSRIGVLLVTKDSERWLPDTLASIERQTRAADDRVAVDDGSSDETRGLLERAGFRVLESTSTSSDVTTRIAQNFVQGARACESCDIVVLGDHDDIWHGDRIAHQAGILEVWAEALMLASDGRLVDVDGRPTGGTLRSVFPVPADWTDRTPADRMRAVLRSSVATGGASAIRPAAFPSLDVPDGWLHDRWWSMVATGRNGMLIDVDTVIDYRVQPGQQLGLDRGAQQASGGGRLAALLGQGPRALRRTTDLRTSLRPLITDPEVAAVVRLRNVL